MFSPLKLSEGQEPWEEQVGLRVPQDRHSSIRKTEEEGSESEGGLVYIVSFLTVRAT